MAEPQNLTMVQAVNLALDEAMAADPKVIAIGEDIGDQEGGGVMGVTKGLSTKYGENRVRTAPISEQAIVGAAIGASMVGYRPMAEVMLMNFMSVAMDMVVNHAAKLRFMSGGQTTVPIVIRTMTGTGIQSGGQHSDYLEAWFAHTPGIKVVAPSNPQDAYSLMHAALKDDDPVLFVENIPLYFVPGPVAAGVEMELGKANVSRDGEDVTIVAHSRMVAESLAAAETLSGDGISAEVIDLRTIAPWDRDGVLNSVRKTGRLLVVHEAVKEHGIGAEIAAVVNAELFGELKAPIARLGGAFAPVPFSKPLEDAYAPNRTDIEESVRSLVK